MGYINRSRNQDKFAGHAPLFPDFSTAHLYSRNSVGRRVHDWITILGCWSWSWGVCIWIGFLGIMQHLFWYFLWTWWNINTRGLHLHNIRICRLGLGRLDPLLQLLWEGGRKYGPGNISEDIIQWSKVTNTYWLLLDLLYSFKVQPAFPQRLQYTILGEKISERKHHLVYAQKTKNTKHTQI